MSAALRFGARSDVGRVRRDNQDSGYAGPHLLAVADGVGGAARGDLASATAIAQMRTLDQPPGNGLLSQLEATLLRTHERLAELVVENPEVEGTSTTFTGGIFDGERLGLVHVGDSRAYLLRDDRLEQLTHDHTFVQSLVDEGRITAEEARSHPHRNMILRALDGVHDPEPDSFLVELRPGDRVLLCSDGCCGVLPDAEIAQLMEGDDLDVVCNNLVNASLDAGSTDNVTVVVAEVLEGEVADVTGAAPLVVGAAAGDPRIGSSWKWGRRERSDEPADPEDLRYAPREPGRFRWFRRLAAVAVVAVLVWLAGSWAYSWTQTQYYVADQDGQVAIFRGVEADIPFVKLHTLLDKTDIELSALPDHTSRDVRSGRPAGTLERAREIVTNLRVQACGRASAAPSRTTSPTATPRTPAPTRKASPSRTATPSPSATPSDAPTGSCEPAP